MMTIWELRWEEVYHQKSWASSQSQRPPPQRVRPSIAVSFSQPWWLCDYDHENVCDEDDDVDNAGDDDSSIPYNTLHRYGTSH